MLIQNRFGARLPHTARGEGVWLLDTAGRRYLDGSSGAARLRPALQRLAGTHPAVLDVRGRGLLRGLELAAAGPVPAAALRLRDRALDAGLLIYPATGGFVDAVLVAPPLTSTDDEIDEPVDRLDRALRAAVG